VSPILKSSTTPPQYAWANTILGDPKSDATGVISYLSTKSDANLNGFVDAIAVNQNGEVVAVLSTDHLWYSAQFVARIAYIVATGRAATRASASSIDRAGRWSDGLSGHSQESGAVEA